MNMMLHGISRPNIVQADSLSKSFDQKPKYDVVFANPPFAGYVDRSDISDNFKIDTAKTELLFLELFYNLLNIGGKAAVIVPSGVLFGSSNAHVKARQIILENSDLQAVVSMPAGVFKPYSGVSTAVLLFVKGGKTEKVWFYEMISDGYSLDDKRDFVDGKGNIPDILENFKKGRVESSRSILVPLETIRKNNYGLSISRYKQTEPEEVEYEEPKIMIDELLDLEEQIKNGLEELKGMISGFG